jgi:hypothetical protein
MKVKSLLKTLSGIEYWITSENGTGLENGYISELAGYDDTSEYEDCKVTKITTDNTTMYITIK